LPSYLVDPTGSKKIIRLKKAPREHRIEKLVAMYPKLLGHKRTIVWFWKRPNGPGDLFGFDAIGRPVVVEFKKKMGKGEEKKALAQLPRAGKTIKKLSEEEIEKHYGQFRTKYLTNQKCQLSFKEHFEEVTGHKFHRHMTYPYSYAVASYFTSSGLLSAKRTIRRRVRNVYLVTIQILDDQQDQYLVSTEAHRI
jgi:hypothetical protein